jgi:glycerate kinase
VKVLVAPDKFKGSLTAVEAAAAMAEGVRAALPDAEVLRHPIADGGEGTTDVLVAAGATAVTRSVRGPLEETVSARYAVLGGAAYVESAQACGLGLVGERSPRTALLAHTWGVGELIADAVQRGCSQVVLTVGGTASTDGGCGMLQALGAHVLDGSGRRIGLGGACLSTVAALDLSPVAERMRGVDVVVATDVDNPLLGEEGAAAVFGPQKGAGPREVAVLDEALGVWARALNGVELIAGSGAGGGLAAGALAGLSAVSKAGLDAVAELSGLWTALEDADLVITGEGSLDTQSLQGKAPVSLARRARVAQVPALAVAGRVGLEASQLDQAGLLTAFSLADVAASTEQAMRFAAGLLSQQTRRAVLEWSRAGRPRHRR